MKCRNCKRQIEDNSLFCNWCGERQIRQKAKERIPRAEQKPNGTWMMRLMIDGHRTSKTFHTEQEAVDWAREQKLHADEIKNTPMQMALRDAVDLYITNKENVLSVSTVRGYRCYARERFQSLMPYKVAEITDQMAQAAINAEMLVKDGKGKQKNGKSKPLSPKTIRNAWGLISSACSDICGCTFKVTLPKKEPHRHEFLEPEDIKPFLKAVRGSRSELAILLGLHSLRLSEILALQKDDINLKKETISVHASVVRGENGLTRRENTKNQTSARIIPILIPRLKEIADQLPIEFGEKALRTDIRNACEKLGIANIGIHGLRHSFASLAASESVKMPEQEIMRIGGWATNNIMKSVYTHTITADRQNAEQSFKAFFADDGKKKN